MTQRTDMIIGRTAQIVDVPIEIKLVININPKVADACR